VEEGAEEQEDGKPKPVVLEVHSVVPEIARDNQPVDQVQHEGLAAQHPDQRRQEDTAQYYLELVYVVGTDPWLLVPVHS